MTRLIHSSKNRHIYSNRSSIFPEFAVSEIKAIDVVKGRRTLYTLGPNVTRVIFDFSYSFDEPFVQRMRRSITSVAMRPSGASASAAKL